MFAAPMLVITSGLGVRVSGLSAGVSGLGAGVSRVGAGVSRLGVGVSGVGAGVSGFRAVSVSAAEFLCTFVHASTKIHGENHADPW